MTCPECDNRLGITIKEEEKFFHIYEICAYCGYAKVYIDDKEEGLDLD